MAPVPCSTFHVSATEAHWAALGAASPPELPAEGDTHVWSSFSTCAGDTCGHHVRIWNGLPDDCKLRCARLHLHLFNARVWGKRARHIEQLLPLELIEHVGGELLPICGDTHLPCCDGRHCRWATRGWCDAAAEPARAHTQGQQKTTRCTRGQPCTGSSWPKISLLIISTREIFFRKAMSLEGHMLTVFGPWERIPNRVQRARTCADREEE